jgi:hypothetical protein
VGQRSGVDSFDQLLAREARVQEVLGARRSAR